MSLIAFASKALFQNATSAIDWVAPPWLDPFIKPLLLKKEGNPPIPGAHLYLPGLIPSCPS